MACQSPTCPSLESSDDSARQPLSSPFSLRDSRPPNGGTQVSTRSRRRCQRHALSLGSASTLTDSSSTDLPILHQLQSFPPFRENGNPLWRRTTRMLTRVVRFVRGSTSLLTPHLPSADGSASASNGPRISLTISVADLYQKVVDDDNSGVYIRAIRLATPILGAQAIPMSLNIGSHASLPSPMLIPPSFNIDEQSQELDSPNCPLTLMFSIDPPTCSSLDLPTSPFDGSFPSQRWLAGDFSGAQ